MNFNITGDYITELARSWFYEERRPYKVVEELLLECMCGTDTPKETLKGYAFDIINLTRKFVGETQDDSFGLIEEEKEKVEILRKKYPLYKYVDELITSGKLPFEICEYGFIDTNGKYIPVGWCEHTEYASDWIQANISIEELMKSAYRLHATDFIVYEKGWVLIDNPYQERGIVTLPPRLTDKQQETLYDYYMYFGRTKDAVDLFKEE